MKKKILILLFILSTILLIACSNNTIQQQNENNNDFTIKLNKTIKFNDFEITIKELKVVKEQWEDNLYGLRITFDWKNTSKEDLTPSFSYLFTSYQEDEKILRAVVSDNIDYDLSLNTVEPDKTIKNVQDAVPINDLNKPLLLELSEFFSEDLTYYRLEIKDLNEYR